MTPALGRFAQADSIIPQPGNPVAWDRFAGMLNNPVRYVDPSGHAARQPMHDYDDDQPKNYNPLPIIPKKVNDNPVLPSGSDGTGDEEFAKNLGDFATVLDNVAFFNNAAYALVGDIVILNCPVCAPFVLGGYQLYSYIPNSISTVSAGL